MRSAFRLLAGWCLVVAVAATADGASARGTTGRGAISHHFSHGRIHRRLKLPSANNGTPIAADQLDAVSWPSRLSINLPAAPSAADANFNNGGVLALRDPLSTDLVNLGRVHTRLHYFSPSNGIDTQQAVGIKFSIQY